MKCFLNRWRISQALNAGKSPAETVKKHTKACGPCGRFYEVHTALAETLSCRESNDEGEFPAGLHTRIISSLKDPSTPREVDGIRPFMAWGLAALAVLIICGTVFLLPSDNEKSVKNGPTIEGLPPYDLNPAAIIDQIDELVTSPYANELEMIKKDVKIVTAFLGLNL